MQGTSGSPVNFGRVLGTPQRSPAGRQQCTTRCEVNKIARSVWDSNGRDCTGAETLKGFL